MPKLSGNKAATEDSKQDPYNADTGAGATYTPPSSEGEKPKSKAPDAETVLARATELENYWLPRNERMQKHQDLYDLREKKAKRGQMKVYANDPRVITRKVAGMAARRSYRIEVPPKAETAIQSAQRIENAHRWWDKHTNRKWVDGLHNNLVYDECLNLFKRGWICSRIMLDPDDETFTDFTLFDPYTVYPKAQGKGYAYVCHVYTTTIDDLLSDFPNAPKRFKEMDGKHRVKCIGYYEGKEPYWHCVVADGEFIKEPKELGYFPWVIQVADGDLSADGIGMTYDDDRPARVGCSFLDALESSYEKLNQFVTIFANAAVKMENPPRMWYTVDGAPKEISLDAGANNFALTSEKFQLLEIAPKIANLIPLIQFFEGRIDKGSLPAVMFGGSSGTNSGFDRAMAMGAAEDTLWTFMEALAAYRSKKYEKWLSLYRDFGDKPIKVVSKAPRNPRSAALVGPDGRPFKRVEPGRLVWGDELTTDDIQTNGIYCEVIYEDISPQDRVALGQLAVMLVDKGLVSRRTARDKYLGMDDPDLENDRVLAESVYFEPTAVRALARRAMKRAGMTEELKALDEAERPKPPQGMPPNGMSQLVGPGGRPLSPMNNDPGLVGLPPEVLSPEMAGIPEEVPNDEQLIADMLMQMAA